MLLKNSNDKKKPRRIIIPAAAQTPVRNAVVLPNGREREPLGSGVITGVLGSGGMANVYEIWNNDLEVFRAVKLLHPNYTEETKQRFQTEIKITAKLHHPNIIEIHAVGHWNSLPYIEMEKLTGETLETTIGKRGAVPLEVCTSVGIMIGRALRYAHNQDYAIYGTTYHGVIHRDLKPSNIMITESGVVKLMDFGIARPTDASIHTTDGSILGTMQYLSPEQLEGQEPDIRADIYSLGAIIYEMLTGVKAFPDTNVSKLMMAKIKNDFPSLSGFNVQIPRALRGLVHRCLAQDRDRRIPDCDTFLDKLDRIHQKISGVAPEEVVRRFLEDSAVVYHVASSRRQLYNKMALTGGVAVLISLAAWQLPQLISKRTESDIPAATNVTEETGPVSVKENEITADTIEKQLAAATHLPSPSMPAKRVPVVSAEKIVPEKKISLRDSLIELYGTTELLPVFSKKVQQKRFSEALIVYKVLTPSEKKSVRATVFLARALRGTGKKKELEELLSATTHKDGELYLERARLDFIEGRYNDAGRWLALCERTPGAFLESQQLRVERLYLEAKCVSRMFEKTHSDSLKRVSLDRWYEVQSALRTSRDHPYFREARQQMQQIAAQKAD